MSRTNVRLEDLRLFSAVAEARGFSAAARVVSVPKQTLSRRIGELERALGVQLLHRTTRTLRLTEVGAAYAARCAEVVRLADEATRSVTDAHAIPRGVLRVSADPLFGETFVTPLIVDYAKRYPHVSVEVVLTRRRVDLVDEGFDVAFRVGHVDEPSLTASSLGPARIRYCASPGYLARHGTPKRPEALRAHECIALVAEGAKERWPFAGKKGVQKITPQGRLRFNSFAMARAAALGGLGIAIFPEFACLDDLRKNKLVSLLEAFVVDVGAVWLVHKASRYLEPRVRAFVDLALERFGKHPPWLK